MKTPTTPPWIIEPFSSTTHPRDTFACGYPALDEYIRKFASQDIKKKVAQVFVACSPGEQIISGYYTTSAASFRKEELPLALAKKLPHYPVPAAIIGRLAVDLSCQGQGLGVFLLADCLTRILQASQQVAINAVIVDAKDERAKAFYLKYGFTPFATNPLRLFISLATLEQARK